MLIRAKRGYLNPWTKGLGPSSHSLYITANLRHYIQSLISHLRWLSVLVNAFAKRLSKKKLNPGTKRGRNVSQVILHFSTSAANLRHYDHSPRFAFALGELVNAYTKRLLIRAKRSYVTWILCTKASLRPSSYFTLAANLRHYVQSLDSHLR